MTLRLTMAMSGYDHVRDLTAGAIRVEGAELTTLTLPLEEIFYRFLRYREWHVSELSLAKYVALRAGGDDSLQAIPVFPSRVCRHSSSGLTARGSRRGWPAPASACPSGRRRPRSTRGHCSSTSGASSCGT
jgi:4,5-dihydroxyphthalate decarboxylase